MAISKDIPSKDKRVLSNDNDVHYTSRESIEAEEFVFDEKETESIEVINEYVDQYEKIVDINNKIIQLIDSKAESFEFIFDKGKNPELASAIKKVFGYSSNVITYDMYRQVIEEQIILNKKMEAEMLRQ